MNKNHLKLIKASILAYGPNRTVISEIGFPHIDFFNRFDSQAFLASKNDHAILAFRGTERNIHDLITDFKGKKVRHNKIVGRIHEGFLDGYLAISKQINEALQDREIKNLEVTGHSLGGTLAQVFTVINKSIETVVFGSPRVFDTTAAKWIDSGDSIIIRYENNNDLIPHLPTIIPSWLFPIPFIPTGFRHAGERRYIDANGLIHINPSKTFRMKDLISGILKHEGPLFGDHYKENYYKLLDRYVTLSEIVK